MYEIEKILVRIVLAFTEVESVNAFFGSAQNTAVLVGTLIALAGGSLGCFLLLRGMSLSSDAISHTVLMGIVVAFMLMAALGMVPDISSPFLLIGAAAAGVGTVFLTEILQRTGLLKQDAALGLVFPFLFAIAIIFISRYVDDVHLDSDAVMVGEIGIAWADTNTHTFGDYETITITPDDDRAEFTRQCANCQQENIDPRDEGAVFAEICGNCGEYSPIQAYQAGFISERPSALFWPRSITTMLLLSILTLAFILLFFKELKLSTFDPALAQSLGFNPTLLLYLLMTLVSLVTVGAFDAVGSVLVIAFFIIPPATAYLLSDRLELMLLISAIIGGLSVFFGYELAKGYLFGLNLSALMNIQWDTSISASIAVTMLLIFIIVLLLSPRYGIISNILRRGQQKQNFEEQVLMGHILHHAGTTRETTELARNTLAHHIQWDERRIQRVLSRLTTAEQTYITANNIVLLSEKGRNRVEKFWREKLARKF